MMIMIYQMVLYDVYDQCMTMHVTRTNLMTYLAHDWAIN